VCGKALRRDVHALHRLGRRDGSRTLVSTALAAGKYARITVRDDGHGLDAEQAVGVFDPALSKTGDPASAVAALALARAYSVVHEWGGDIASRANPARFDIHDLFAAR